MDDTNDTALIEDVAKALYADGLAVYAQYWPNLPETTAWIDGEYIIGKDRYREQAKAIIPIVRADERNRICENLLSDETLRVGDAAYHDAACRHDFDEPWVAKPDPSYAFMEAVLATNNLFEEDH